MISTKKKIAISTLISSFLIIFLIITSLLIAINNRRESFWFYDTGNNVYSVAISSDGSYFTAGTETSIYFFSNFI